MKTSMTLTLDGLVRALRGRVHTLADEIEAGYRREPADRAPRRMKGTSRPVRKARGEPSDDIARR